MTPKRILRESRVKPREPLINDPDNFRRMPIVKMVRSFDVPVGPARARRGGKLLGIFVKKFRFGATDDGEQWAANSLRVGTAIVAIVLAVFVQMRARAENSRRSADGNRHQLFTFAFGHQSFCFFYGFTKRRLPANPFRIELFGR